MAVNVGLDIGATGVRAVALDVGKQPPVVRRIGQVDIEPGAVVAGEIVDASAVTDAVSRLWKEAKLPKRRVVLGLAENQKLIPNYPQCSSQFLNKQQEEQVKSLL